MFINILKTLFLFNRFRFNFKTISSHFCLLTFFVFFNSLVFAQVTIAVQDFDGAVPTMAFTGGAGATGNGAFPSTPKFVSTSNGRQVSNTSDNITFSTVNTSAYTSIFYTMRLASFSGTSGNGADATDEAIISVSIDGGTSWSQELLVKGPSAANARWGFSGTNAGTGSATITYDGDNTPTQFQPAGTGYRTTDGYTFLRIDGLPSTTTLRIRVELVNNSTSEFWVIDDAVISGTLAVPSPEINIQGNSNNILDGDYVPSLTDDTDFGSIDVNTGTITKTFTIENIGTLDLNSIVASLSFGTDFNIISFPGATVTAGNSTTFQVTFDPSTIGTKTDTLIIASNDSDENPYKFLIQGTGTLPEINFNVTSASVSENGTSYDVIVTSSYIGPHTADIIISGGTATNGTEYTLAGLPITTTFGGSTSFSTTVTINNNGTCDGNTNVIFGLNNNVNSTIGSDNTLDLLIVDDEQSTYTFSSIDFEGCNTASFTTGGSPSTDGTKIQVNGYALSGGESFTTSSIDVSVFSDLVFSIDYSSSGMDAGEDGILELYYDGSVTPDFTFNIIDNGVDNGILTTYSTTIPNGTSSVIVKISNSANGTSDFVYLDNIKIEGTYCACTPPVSTAIISNETSTSNSISFDLNSPSGVERLVVIREASAVTCDPINTVSYTGNTVYGSGDEVGESNFVVHSGTSTSLTVTNLSSETDYHIAVYDYDVAQNCYNMTQTTTVITTVCPSPLTDVTGESVTGCTSGESVISWTLPVGCYDEILVVANESPGIGFTPSGDGTSYTPNTVYGGVDQVVYLGTSTTVTVSGLNYNTTYYYEIFVRKGTSWSNGVEVNCTIDYCTPAPSSVDNDGITNVTMGTINNTTGVEAGNYGDYSAMVTTVVQGTTVNCDITFSTGFTYNTIIWVDWNNDGDFDDVGEEVYTGTSLATNPTTLNATFTVPGGATLGTHRVRIGGADLSTPTPCYTGSYASYEDYSINVISPCVPVHSITSFAPSTGPELTQILIVGTNFSASTTVTIDGKTATVTFVNSDTIYAEVPTGATSGKIDIFESACSVQSASDYTLIPRNTVCIGPSNFTDLIISEVYDSDALNVWYMEFYNPTAFPIDLDDVSADYTLERFGNIGDPTATRTIDLVGIIPPGGVFVAKLGDSGDACTYPYDFIDANAGINENDEIKLLKNGVVVDVVECPNQTGYTILRNGTATGPTATYSAADWTLNVNEDCAHLGIAPVLTVSSPTLTPDPVDITGAVATFSSVATDGNGGTLTYQWKYNDGVSDNWLDVTPAAFAPSTVTGETTDDLSISGGNMNDFENYQFYLEVVEDGTCTLISDAAQYTPDLLLSSSSLMLSGINNINQNTLTWEVKNDENTKYFELEKSEDLINFKSLSSINVTSSNEYKFIDKNPFDNSYYRVKQIYNNGYRYSNVVFLKNEVSNNFKIYPNPTKGVININFNSLTNKDVEILIFDIAGRKVLEKYFYIEVEGAITLDINNFDSGVYILQLQNQGLKESIKVIKN